MSYSVAVRAANKCAVTTSPPRVPYIALECPCCRTVSGVCGLALPCALKQASIRLYVLMLRSGAERLPVVRHKQAYRVALLSVVTLIAAALLSSPLYQLSTLHRQPEVAHGDRQPSSTRITLCTQVLNEVSAVANAPAHNIAAGQDLIQIVCTSDNHIAFCVCRYPTCWNGSSSTRCKVRL